MLEIATTATSNSAVNSAHSFSIATSRRRHATPDTTVSATMPAPGARPIAPLNPWVK